MLGTVTIAQLTDAIATALANAGLTVQSYDDLTEGINEWPVIQVYPEAGELTTAPVDRATFRSRTGGIVASGQPVRIRAWTIHIDVYAKQRSQIGDDMAALLPVINAVEGVLDNQRGQPFFGLAGIRAMAWSWGRVVFEYGDPLIRYIGARFVIRCQTF